MGMILNLNRVNNSYELLDLLIRYLIKPSIMNDPLLSPGWTLAVTIITFLFLSLILSSTGSVIVNNGTCTPLKL